MRQEVLKRNKIYQKLKNSKKNNQNRKSQNNQIRWKRESEKKLLKKTVKLKN